MLQYVTIFRRLEDTVQHQEDQRTRRRTRNCLCHNNMHSPLKEDLIHLIQHCKNYFYILLFSF